MSGILPVQPGSISTSCLPRHPPPEPFGDPQDGSSLKMANISYCTSGGTPGDVAIFLSLSSWSPPSGFSGSHSLSAVLAHLIHLQTVDHFFLVRKFRHFVEESRVRKELEIWHMFGQVLIFDLLLQIKSSLFGQAIRILVLLPGLVLHIGMVLIQPLNPSSRHAPRQESALLSVRSVNFPLVKYGRYFSKQ